MTAGRRIILRGLYPDQPIVGVGSLVIINDRVLLVKRAAPPDKDKWAIPGGKVELGEGLYAAAERELAEETGLLCSSKGVVNVDEIITRDENGKVMFHYILITVLMENCRGTPRASSDAVDVRLFDIKEASESAEVAASTREFLKKVMRGLTTMTNPIEVITTSSR